MAARKPPNRSTDTQINIRMKTDQKELLERAAAKKVEGIAGAKVALSGWLLDLGLREAKKILGEK